MKMQAEKFINLFDSMMQEYFYQKKFNSMNRTEKAMMHDIIRKIFSHDHNERQFNINRLFLDDPNKPKRFALMQDLLTNTNSRSKREL